MLTEQMMGFTLLGAEWILWVLIFLSVASVALIIERLTYFATHRLPGAERMVAEMLSPNGGPAAVAYQTRPGIEAAVLRAGERHRNAGPKALKVILALTISQERGHYERGLAFLGTLGANAPFIGLFGTVLGIIKAFHELAQATHQSAQAAASGAPQVMSGISEALVATAIGLLVAIPAVVAFNIFNRWLAALSASAQHLADAIIAQILRDAHSAKTPEQR